MNSIKTIGELRSEISRLEESAQQQESRLRDDWKELKESLQPRNLLVNLLSSLTGIKLSNPDFFRNGLASGISLLVQRYILKKESKVENVVYGWVDGIFDMLRKRVDRFASARARRNEREDQSEKTSQKD